MGTICLFTGCEDAPNVRLDVQNIAWMLADEFDIHIVSTAPDSFDTVDDVTFFGGDESSTRLGEANALRQYLKTTTPDVVTQITKPPLHGTVAGVQAKRHDVPFVFRYSGDRFYAYTVFSGLKKVGCYLANNIPCQLPVALANRCIALGPVGKQRLRTHTRTASDVAILPPPFDESRFSSDTSAVELDIPEDRAVATFIGRRSWLKGFDLLEETIPRVLDHRNDLHFVILGEGTRSPNVPERYRNHISIIGTVPPDTLPEYLNQTDVLVHPSLTEGMPRVVAEAGFCETPAIARRTGDTQVATDHTFTDDVEFGRMIRNFEKYKPTDVSNLSREALQEDYVSFFHSVV